MCSGSEGSFHREEVITIVSLLSGDSILLSPSGKREAAWAARKALVSSEGDHITLLKVYRAFKQSKDQSEFCQRHFLHFRHLQFVVDIRKQLMELCQRNNIKVQSCQDTEVVRQALSRGLFTNVAKLTKEGHYVTVRLWMISNVFDSKNNFFSVGFSTKGTDTSFISHVSKQTRSCDIH